jgi:predicted O-methyltransferase YrrM
MDDKVAAVLDTYHELIREQENNRELIPAADRHTARDRRLLAVGPQTGRLINILARSLTAPNILELGTSYGYSGIWLAEAARASGGRVTTMELQDHNPLMHARWRQRRVLPTISTLSSVMPCR